MPEGQTEVERRYLKYGKKSIQMQKRNIFARIPLPTSLTLGHLPPGGRYIERYLSARQTLEAVAAQQLTNSYAHLKFK